MKKRRHHFVWKAYLDPWVKVDKIWVCREGKIFNTNPINIAVESDFYRLKELTPLDIEFTRMVFRNEMSGPLGAANNGWLDAFQAVFRLRAFCESKGVVSGELAEHLEKAIQNSEENLHALIEADASDYITLVRGGDVAFFAKSKGRMEFAHYLATQYFRTRKIQEMWVAGFATSPHVTNVNVRNCWAIGRHIMGTQVAASLMNNPKFRLIHLRNKTSIPFITGDQPVLNTHVVGKWGKEIPTNTQFYYPISPQSAILVSTELASDQEIEVDEGQVWEYNMAIADVTDQQLYGDSTDILEECFKRYKDYFAPVSGYQD